MEMLGLDPSFWKDRRVLVTGHTGFKGSWMTLWLQHLGARVTGYALEAPTRPSLFELADVAASCSHHIGDVRDLDQLLHVFAASQPEVVFHLAAQPLVRASYRDPLATMATNVMGTAHVLEAARHTLPVRAVVVVTTDKCYENREWLWPYRENDALGGHDPYSVSKACAELVTSAWRNSFAREGLAIASARAGNVIGGGDWADDRLVPDFLRALDAGHVLAIRSPLATRPWQHVLEPLSGYLMLAERLFTEGQCFAEAWNFGPEEVDAKPVQWIVEYLCSQVPDASWQCDAAPQPHEANMLKLDSSKAKIQLGWRPRWNLRTALGMTLAWHQAWKQDSDMAAISVQQIQAYEAAARQA